MYYNRLEVSDTGLKCWTTIRWISIEKNWITCCVLLAWGGTGGMKKKLKENFQCNCKLIFRVNFTFVRIYSNLIWCVLGSNGIYLTSIASLDQTANNFYSSNLQNFCLLSLSVAFCYHFTSLNSEMGNSEEYPVTVLSLTPVFCHDCLPSTFTLAFVQSHLMT